MEFTALLFMRFRGNDQTRVDDAKKGGDIDLLFETDHWVSNRATAMGSIYVALIRPRQGQANGLPA